MKKSVLHSCGLAAVLASAWFWQNSTAQEPDDRKLQKSEPTGVATGAPHAPVKDDLSRPITAGGFVDGAPVVFVDVTKQAGLDSFRHRSGTPEKATILEMPGSGVALLDYDNDGWLDIYLLNGSTLAALKGKEPAPRAMLLHNNHNGTFTDVTDKAGVANERWGFGVAVGDYDNDGWPDIYVANYGKNRLFHNNHDGTFSDVAEKAGVALGGWSTGPTWGDYDHDGALDLFVPGYVKFDAEHPPVGGRGGIPLSACQYRGVNFSMCGPRGLPGESDHLFHNNGDGTFTDVSKKAGVDDPQGYYGLASVFVDVDDDGWLDLAVANDSVPRYLYHNLRNGTFEDASYLSGFALTNEGLAQASMGIAVGDYNRDGRLDFCLTTFSDDYKTLYRNDGEINFSDVTYRAGLGAPTIPFLGWGTGFLDYDNDGLLDIFFANGHVYPAVDQRDWGTTWAERPQLFRNLNGMKFEEVPPATGSGLGVVIAARGAAFGDLFNDGHIDVVLNTIDSAPVLLRNVVKSNNHWIGFKLVGGRKSPRDAVGAKAFVTAAGTRQRGDVFSGGSYASSSDQRLHFGLGTAAKIDKVEIYWPSGKKEEVIVPGVDRILTVVEGQGVVEK
ncbi:MAG: CRTAC1 family protein [Acidobacteria bacterium Pan2503]|uniref:CRTAC1 family protein n=1 Tax=Candidatus Acidiferrum panamense TaxID=2741543 RepID=A0A7V8NPZ4_9BACT|nr:CRTAC1 family protein [Candidatus Acidoferrum panamensis]